MGKLFTIYTYVSLCTNVKCKYLEAYFFFYMLSITIYYNSVSFRIQYSNAVRSVLLLKEIFKNNLHMSCIRRHFLRKLVRRSIITLPSEKRLDVSNARRMQISISVVINSVRAYKDTIARERLSTRPEYSPPPQGDVRLVVTRYPVVRPGRKLSKIFNGRYRDNTAIVDSDGSRDEPIVGARRSRSPRSRRGAARRGAEWNV